ncbi:DMT family transporter [Actinoplanes sichuanensis]|uniref:DMT family transporter n=1 Tax=Actinoplanes sichuanensis TaxID=512349 RepID=A0ABW4A601_9ACTN|nr:DMT family transporter [Actinoplanes sichuanensis]
MGPLLCLLSAAGFGAMSIFGKFAYDAGVSPSALLLVRFVMAALILAGLLALRPVAGRAPLSRPSGWTVSAALALGAVGFATQATLYFEALRLMDASLLSLILYTYPLMVTAAAVLLRRDRMTRNRAIALAVASAGTLLVLLGAGAGALSPLGAALGFGAALTYTIYILASDRVLRSVPPMLLATLVMTGAALALAGKALVTGGVDLGFSPAGWFWVTCIAVVSTVLASLTFFAGLRRTGPSTAAILSTVEPVITTTLAAVTLGEFLTPAQLAGGVLVLASVAVVQLRPRRATRAQAPVPSAERAANRPRFESSRSAVDRVFQAEVADRLQVDSGQRGTRRLGGTTL